MTMLIERAADFRDRIAVRDRSGDTTYRALLDRSARVASGLLRDQADLAEARIAFLAGPGRDHVATQWAIWRAGGIALPLGMTQTELELTQLIDDAGPIAIVGDAETTPRLLPIAQAHGIRIARTDELGLADPKALPTMDSSRRALMVYTSGTTGRPKGVVTTHAALGAQIKTLVDAWGWSKDDSILHALPLNHIHGIVNALSCALWSGATCHLMPRFDATAVWQHFLSGSITLFMAVPTMYARLAKEWDAADAETRAAWSDAASQLRLMVSGSAALPVDLLERWRAITGHTLLERYGMTEIGMALSNPLIGERRAGTVGMPLPGVEVRVVDDAGASVREGVAGDIEVRGPQVFREYWNRPEETRSAFRDGWFHTGDVAIVQDRYYTILGRKSTDIIKTAGYKVSALEIEGVLRQHGAVEDCAVVGIADADLGERIAAAVVLRPGVALDEGGLTAWARGVLSPHKVPREVRFVAALPRNAMGKTIKPDVSRLFGVVPNARSVPNP